MPQAQLQQLWNEGNKQNIQNYFGLTFQGTVGQVGGSWFIHRQARVQAV